MDYAIDVLVLSISVVATFLSANPKINKIWIIAFLNLACGTLILVYGLLFDVIEMEPGVYYGTSGLLVLLAVFASIYIARHSTYSKKRVAKKMIKFTNNVKSYDKIRLFCGDVDFLGNVSDGSIEKNEQYRQFWDLNHNKACGIQILCFKPIGNREFMLRIGFLQKHIQGLQIKFYIDRKCDENCDQRKNHNIGKWGRGYHFDWNYG